MEMKIFNIVRGGMGATSNEEEVERAIGDLLRSGVDIKHILQSSAGSNGSSYVCTITIWYEKKQ
mgnify:CR=1 FL=1